MSTNAELLKACDTLAAEFLRQRHDIDIQRHALGRIETTINASVNELARIRAQVEALSPEHPKRYSDVHTLLADQARPRR